MLAGLEKKNFSRFRAWRHKRNCKKAGFDYVPAATWKEAHHKVVGGPSLEELREHFFRVAGGGKTANSIYVTFEIEIDYGGPKRAVEVETAVIQVSRLHEDMEDPPQTWELAGTMNLPVKFDENLEPTQSTFMITIFSGKYSTSTSEGEFIFI